MERKDWLEARRAGLGGSDAGAVLGVDPHRTPLDVFLSKLKPEMLSEPPEQDYLDFCRELEPSIARRYTLATGVEVYTPSPEIVVHPYYPQLIGTPDRLSDSPIKRVVELKFESQWADQFGDESSDQIPPHYIAQVAHYMAVTNRDVCDVALLHRNPPIRVYTIHRDLELERLLTEKLLEWWDSHIVHQQEPPITGDSAWSEYLSKRFPRNMGQMVKIAASEPIHKVMELLLLSRGFLEKYEKDVEESKNVIKNFIGERDGIICPDGTRITWKATKPQVADVVDWQGVAEQMAVERFPGERFREIVEMYTERGKVLKQGSRRFMLTEPKGGK